MIIVKAYKAYTLTKEDKPKYRTNGLEKFEDMQSANKGIEKLIGEATKKAYQKAGLVLPEIERKDGEIILHIIPAVSFLETYHLRFVITEI